MLKFIRKQTQKARQGYKSPDTSTRWYDPKDLQAIRLLPPPPPAKPK